jgi:hypothetical protein
MAVSMKPQPCAAALALSRENFTSADVIGVPFENFTPERNVKVYVFFAFVTLYPVAKSGCTDFPSGVTV